jgi:hypothetical protein
LGKSGLPAFYRNGQETRHYSIIETLGGGVGMIDFDRDGLEDVFLPGGGWWHVDDSLVGNPHALLRNLGNLKFLNQATLANVASDASYSHGANVGDYDQDGFSDLHVTGMRSQSIFQNQGDGTFEDISERCLLSNEGWAASSAWADLNRDGQLDLYVTHYARWSAKDEPRCIDTQGERDVCGPTDFVGEQDMLFFQNGDGSFRDESARIKEPAVARGLGVVAADFDSDGDTDMYVANDANPNFLLENQSDGTFKEIGVQSGTALGSNSFPDGSMGIGLGDFDNNRFVDFLVTNFDGQFNELYANQGDGYYRIATRTAGMTALGNGTVGWGVVWNDVDSDGDEDVMFLTGHPSYGSAHHNSQQRPVFMENDGSRRLVSRGEQVGEFFGIAAQGRGLAMADLDRDGDFDAVASLIEDQAQLLRNDTPRSGDYLQIELIGTASNRDAIGAIVECHTANSKWVRHRYGGGSYCSTSSSVVHFGLGQTDKVVRVEVIWPSGNKSSLSDVAVNQRLQIVE